MQRMFRRDLKKGHYGAVLTGEYYVVKMMDGGEGRPERERER